MVLVKHGKLLLYKCQTHKKMVEPGCFVVNIESLRKGCPNELFINLKIFKNYYEANTDLNNTRLGI